MLRKIIFNKTNYLSLRMAHTGLLMLSHPSKVGCLLPAIQDHVQNTLYIHVPSALNSSPVNKTLCRIYSETSVLGRKIDVRVLLSVLKYPQLSTIHTRRKIDVVLFDNNRSSTEMNNFLQSNVVNIAPNCQVVNLSKNLGGCESELVTDCDSVDQICPRKMYENVVLGGTFDQLHPGHKILLSEAVMHCSQQLTVGVTDTSMLKSKKLWELIEPCTKRMRSVEDFLNDVDPNLQYKIVPITDPYGPTKEDPNLQMIVVSSETLKGGKMVNDLRAKSGLSTLDIHVVELLTNDSLPTELEIGEAKISSSNHRLQLLGTRIRIPEVKANLPPYPYIIGLTGGIASGKSSMCKRIADLGAGIIDCDRLAHKVYRKGEVCHQLVVKNFGEHILDSQGEVDRRKLGDIVFQNKEKLELLNSILWPHILETAKVESQKLYEKGHKVVIMEAALLIQAGWDQHCHEVWLCIVSPEEALRRLEARNHLSPAEAKARLAAQPCNMELVAHSHVVFCTEWDRSFSQYQAEKAWNELQDFLKTRAVL
ncbi:bifunctional coenzyme A synthase [Anabrus simplex]|uniref:bifunctional coenzyme A synthase n=1 Tax=Anabrus simplex TaxID=316456 RepID=UPI0035A29CBF